MIEIQNPIYNKKKSKISFTLVSSLGKSDIEASVSSAGLFRFSYIHPEVNTKLKYFGIMFNDNKYMMIYPILGTGVIYDKQIKVEVV